MLNTRLMQKHLEITRNRLQTFLRADQLPGKLYPAKAPVKLAVFCAPGSITFAEAMRG